nr:hypothetical protein BaRGS_017704 [Batillaria attramentaria]
MLAFRDNLESSALDDKCVSAMYDKCMLKPLALEFSDLDVFVRVLRVNDKRTLLHHCFQALMDKDIRMSEILAKAFVSQMTPQCISDQANRIRTLNMGLALGGFLSEAGWFDDSERVYQACLDAVRGDRSEAGLCRSMEYCVREHFGAHHPKYSDALLDYGFYLLNVDAITSAVQVYQMALDIRISVFGGNNLFVAIAYEDLAYASYVFEYSSGKFDGARDQANKSIKVLCHILPQDHLLLSSSKRVKALILEEVAIDSHDKKEEEKLLSEAQELHLQSLELAKKAFGENNVQTAKHYGNLGRLYQSMHRFEEAEEMHLKAIDIKERLLGPDDYEVALSVGHLASLYNYDMNKFEEAEKLYLRSINIGKALFGEAYSGLEYDYRGLLRLVPEYGRSRTGHALQ